MEPAPASADAVDPSASCRVPRPGDLDTISLQLGRPARDVVEIVGSCGADGADEAIDVIRGIQDSLTLSTD